MSAEPWDIEAELSSLRWRADIIVTNPFGERVWLRSLRPEEGRGITDCCPEDMPCARHASLFSARELERSSHD